MGLGLILGYLTDMLPTRKITDLFNVSFSHYQRIEAALGNGICAIILIFRNSEDDLFSFILIYLASKGNINHIRTAILDKLRYLGVDSQANFKEKNAKKLASTYRQST